MTYPDYADGKWPSQHLYVIVAHANDDSLHEVKGAFQDPQKALDYIAEHPIPDALHAHYTVERFRHDPVRPALPISNPMTGRLEDREPLSETMEAILALSTEHCPIPSPPTVVEASITGAPEVKPLGYGRYPDGHVGCPRAKSEMTPCVARDAASAVADDGACVGCGYFPACLLRDLVAEVTKGDLEAVKEAS